MSVLIWIKTVCKGYQLIKPSTSKERVKYGPQREKTCLLWFANNKGADQTAHPRSLIIAFIIHLLKSIISRLAMNKISVF